MNKLFKEFNVLKESVQMNDQGCGLGLTICKLIAQTMDGDVKVESKEGIGTSFKVKLPVKLEQVDLMLMTPTQSKANDLKLSNYNMAPF